MESVTVSTDRRSFARAKRDVHFICDVSIGRHSISSKANERRWRGHHATMSWLICHISVAINVHATIYRRVPFKLVIFIDIIAAKWNKYYVRARILIIIIWLAQHVPHNRVKYIGTKRTKYNYRNGASWAPRSNANTAALPSWIAWLRLLFLASSNRFDDYSWRNDWKQPQLRLRFRCKEVCCHLNKSSKLGN